MKKMICTLAAAVVAVIAWATPAVAEEKAKWSCSDSSGTLACTWKECGVSVVGQNDLSLWATGSSEGEAVLHLLRVKNGVMTSQKWMSAHGNQLSITSKPDVFKAECVDGGQLKGLPPEVQQQFAGAYDIPAPTKLEGTATPPGP